MAQHKLNQEGLELVEQARRNLHAMCGWTVTYRGDAYWRDVDKELGKMLVHGTTDGKPYVEPQPEIPEGYRRATEADMGRRDRDMWDSRGRWVTAHVGMHASNYTYRVPVDRIPTDEDAKQRPTVMVQDGVSGKWVKASLLAVTNDDTYPFCVLMDGDVDSWMDCRFPYPGELD
jgi:hypothetical protein